MPLTGPDDGRSPDLPCLPGLGCNPLGSLGADAINSVAQGVFQAFASFVAQGVAATLDAVSAAIANTTEVTLDASWFQDHFDQMRSLGLLVLLPMVLVGIISAVIRRDAAQLWRAGGVYIPVAIIGAAVLIELTNRALAVTDWATGVMSGGAGGSTEAAVASLKTAVQQLSAAGAPDVGTFLAIVVLLVLMAGAVLIWMELLLRTGAIYVVVLFLPLAMTGLVWKATVQWTRRMLEILVALLLSKFVIVAVLTLAAGMMTSGTGVGTVMEGATLLLLAACAPFALLRLVPVVEAGLIGQLEGLERRPIAAARHAASSAAQVAVFGAEAAVATGAIGRNGGDGGNEFSARPEPGGQLNRVRRPADWPDGAETGEGTVSAPPPPTGSGSAPATGRPTAELAEAGGGG
jgi:hypothetical protein